MITYRPELVECKKLYKFTCDKCKKEVSGEVELQETYSIRFTGGYSSVFGDGNNISVDLCQGCLMALVGEFCQYNVDE